MHLVHVSGLAMAASDFRLENLGEKFNLQPGLG